MEENTNKAIVVNTVIMYVRLILVSVFGLFTTRFALHALGVTDYGLFMAVGGVILFMSLLNTIMLSASNRFLAIALGKRDDKLTNETFNVCLTIHCIIAVVTLVIAYPLGNWYVAHHINFDGDITLAKKMFDITIVGAVISFLAVPYNGLMIARERFLVFSLVDILSHLLKMIGALALVYFFNDKLLVYSLIVSVLTALPTFVFLIYCNRNFSAFTKIHFVRKWEMYREILQFSVWTGYGAIATVVKNQGAALVINKFFNTIMNTALGIANSVSIIIQQVAFNVGKSMAPQITKSYAAGDILRATNLTITCSRCTFLLLLLAATPFLVEPDYILQLWLGKVPPYASLFTRLLIIDALVVSLNAGIPDFIFATGKIKWYQLIVNTLLVLSVVAGFFVLFSGKPAYFLQITYVVFSFIILIVRQFVLNQIVKFDNWRLVKESYIPCLTVVILFVPYMLLNSNMNPLLDIILATVYALFLIFFSGLRKTERRYVLSYCKKCLSLFRLRAT